MTPELVNLIRQNVELKSIGGSRYAGKCPFHAEKTASFHVYNAGKKWRYHCHGCGADGDTIDWLRTMRKMTYREAVKFLGDEPAKPTKPAAPRIPEPTDVELLDIHTALWRLSVPRIEDRTADDAWLAKYDCPFYGWASGAWVKADAKTLAARPRLYYRQHTPLSEREKTIAAYRDRNPVCPIPDWSIEA